VSVHRIPARLFVRAAQAGVDEGQLQIAEARRSGVDGVGGSVVVGGVVGAMLRGAITNTRANTQLREFIEARLSADAAQFGSDGQDAAIRVALAASMLIGLTVGRQIVRVTVLAQEEREAIVRRLGPALQAVLLPAPQPVEPVDGKGHD